jgi:hypothetical protein
MDKVQKHNSFNTSRVYNSILFTPRSFPGASDSHTHTHTHTHTCGAVRREIYLVPSESYETSTGRVNVRNITTIASSLRRR